MGDGVSRFKRVILSCEKIKSSMDHYSKNGAELMDDEYF
jgi:hypothetical protein